MKARPRNTNTAYSHVEAEIVDFREEKNETVVFRGWEKEGGRGIGRIADGYG